MTAVPLQAECAQLLEMQCADRVLQQEAEGILDIVVFRGREIAALNQEVARGDALWSRRLAVLNSLLPRYLAGIADRRCIGCAEGFSRDSLPVDFVTAHAQVAQAAATAGIVGGVCRECSEKYAAAELRERFCALLRGLYPDLREVAPASIAAAGGRA